MSACARNRDWAGQCFHRSIRALNARGHDHRCEPHTLLAAAILFFLGSGPVRGFAVTLSIGIFTTIFTAFTLTRLMVALWFKYRKPKALTI